VADVADRPATYLATVVVPPVREPQGPTPVRVVARRKRAVS
jgi:hypothetical protein